jgi:hypothetical protein
VKYEIKSGKSDHVEMHKRAALRKLPDAHSGGRGG